MIFQKKIKKLIVITRGDKGALAIQKEKVFECSEKKDIKIVDLPALEIYLPLVFYMDILMEKI